MRSSRGKNSGADDDSWLLEGSDQDDRLDEELADDAAAEWLDLPEDGRGGRESSETGRSSARRGSRRNNNRFSVRSQREQRLRSKLRHAQGVIAAQRLEIEDLRRQLDEPEDSKPRPRSESKPKAAAKRSTSAKSTSSKVKRKPAAKRAGKRTPKPKRKGSPRRKASAKDKVDLNAASFEDLRDAGLSLTMSARIIAGREMREGYESVDELRDVPGISNAAFKDLSKKVEVATP